jgi:hypothetical protein
VHKHGEPQLLKNLLSVSLVLLSLFNIMGSTGIFSPAILLAIFLMCVSGVIAYFGQLKLGIVYLAITSIALGNKGVGGVN